MTGKVIVAGAANAGKTCLIERFVRNVYAAEEAGHGPTLGCDCLQKCVLVDDTEVNLYLYDTAGQERFADMAASYYRNGDVCLLVFDLGSLVSFDHIKWWQKKVADYNTRCSFLLVGCKEDLVADASDLSVMNRWADSNGIPFFTTSAKKGGPSIQFLFHTVAEKCIRQNRDKQLTQVNAPREQITIDTRSAFGRPQDDSASKCASCP